MRAPWSVHSAVIPRFRAITPVRIEFGVHFLGAGGEVEDDFEAKGFDSVAVAGVECILLTEDTTGGRLPIVHSLCMWKC